MASFTGSQKAYCVLEFAKSESVVTVQRKFRTKYGFQPPTNKTIHAWFRKFQESGCLCDGKRTGRPGPSEEKVDRVRDAFVRSPRQSIRQASAELQIPGKTVWRILRKKLQMKPYRIQLMQHLSPQDMNVRFDFCLNVQRMMEQEDFADKLIFSDESTFHTCGKVNKHNVRIWGTANPKDVMTHVRDSPKVNVFAAMSSSRVYGPFFFMEKTVTGIVYLDMLQLWLMPQLQEDYSSFIFQQDGAPPHYLNHVRHFLNNELPHRWIGRGSDDDNRLLPWPPRSPDLTPCDFFLWGYIKDRVFVPPMPRDLQDLRQRITTAFATIDRDMLKRVWEEFDFRLDICRITKGSHIEHL